jgi:hypothetical protein
MRHCNSGLERPDSILLDVYAAIEDRGLRVDVYRKTEKLVSLAIESTIVNLMKEAEDEIN